MQNVMFQPNRAFWRLDLVTGTSRELTAWPDWKFCQVVLQLSWPFSSPACFTRVSFWRLASREIQSQGSSWVHTSWVFFTLSHTLPLHKSHLNTRYLIAKLQVNLVRNKANTWLNKFNLTYVMRDAEVSRSRTCLLLENRKQNTFAFKNNLESMRIKGLESTKK